MDGISDLFERNNLNIFGPKKYFAQLEGSKVFSKKFMKDNKSNTIDMHVIKRNKKREVISFDKILRRIKTKGRELNLKNIIYAQLTMKIIDQLHDNIETSKIDELTAEQCASMASQHLIIVN